MATQRTQPSLVQRPALPTKTHDTYIAREDLQRRAPRTILRLTAPLDDNSAARCARCRRAARPARDRGRSRSRRCSWVVPHPARARAAPAQPQSAREIFGFHRANRESSRHARLTSRAQTLGQKRNRPRDDRRQNSAGRAAGAPARIANTRWDHPRTQVFILPPTLPSSKTVYSSFNVSCMSELSF